MKVGDRVIWIYTAPGGYGYRYRVPAIVQKVGKKKVTILVEMKSGRFEKRSVKIDTIQETKT